MYKRSMGKRFDTYHGKDVDGVPACFSCLYFDWGCVIIFDYDRYEEQLAYV